MAINFHVLRSSGAFNAEHIAVLNAVFQETAHKCSNRLVLADVDFVVMNVPWNVIPRIGINGYSYDAHQAVLFLDMDHPHLKRHLRDSVISILAHELHHCARARARGNSHSTTYGGSLVAEGLACCFEEEIGQPTPFYAVECHGEALRAFSRRAKNQARTDRSDMPGYWQKWMFGGGPGDTEFPYQCGYSLGYALVKHWLVAEGMRASDAAGVDENVILDLWQNDEIDPFEG
ncbi:MAG: DUF2268 domain-containing putative Zn-dependent protease [Pseudomonadota bacterium]